MKLPDGHLFRRPPWTAHRVRIVPAPPGSAEETARGLYLGLEGDYGAYAALYSRRVLHGERGGAGVGILVLLLGFMALILLLAILGLSWLHTFGLP